MPFVSTPPAGLGVPALWSLLLLVPAPLLPPVGFGSVGAGGLPVESVAEGVVGTVSSATPLVSSQLANTIISIKTITTTMVPITIFLSFGFTFAIISSP